MNIDPHSDTALILVCASSKIEKVRERRKNFPSSTLVEIAPAEYEDFTVRTIIDCNNIFEKSTGQLVEKLVQGKLRLKTEMAEHLIIQLRESVLLSPTVETRIKSMLRE